MDARSKEEKLQQIRTDIITQIESNISFDKQKFELIRQQELKELALKNEEWLAFFNSIRTHLYNEPRPFIDSIDVTLSHMAQLHPLNNKEGETFISPISYEPIPDNEEERVALASGYLYLKWEICLRSVTSKIDPVGNKPLTDGDLKRIAFARQSLKPEEEKRVASAEEEKQAGADDEARVERDYRRRMRREGVSHVILGLLTGGLVGGFIGWLVLGPAGMAVGIFIGFIVGPALILKSSGWWGDARRMGLIGNSQAPAQANQDEPQNNRQRTHSNSMHRLLVNPQVSSRPPTPENHEIELNEIKTEHRPPSPTLFTQPSQTEVAEKTQTLEEKASNRP